MHPGLCLAGKSNPRKALPEARFSGGRGRRGEQSLSLGTSHGLVERETGAQAWGGYGPQTWAWASASGRDPRSCSWRPGTIPELQQHDGRPHVSAPLGPWRQQKQVEHPGRVPRMLLHCPWPLITERDAPGQACGCCYSTHIPARGGDARKANPRNVKISFLNASPDRQQEKHCFQAPGKPVGEKGERTSGSHERPCQKLASSPSALCPVKSLQNLLSFASGITVVCDLHNWSVRPSFPASFLLLFLLSHSAGRHENG